jgi:hypothetical protein
VIQPTPAKTRATEIKRLHEEIVGTVKVTLPKAIRIGELLVEQKASMEYGEWLPWLVANCPFAERTARDYMRFWERRADIGKLADLASARRLLVVPLEEDEEEGEYAILWRRQEFEIPGSSMSVSWNGPDIKERAKDDPHIVIAEYKKLLKVFSTVLLSGDDLGLLEEFRKIIFAFAQGIGEILLDIETPFGPQGLGNSG